MIETSGTVIMMIGVAASIIFSLLIIGWILSDFFDKWRLFKRS